MIYNIKTKDGIIVELTSTSNVRGPDQVGGLHFGMTFLYYRLPGKEWEKCEDNRRMKVVEKIESLTLKELEDTEQL